MGYRGQAFKVIDTPYKSSEAKFKESRLKYGWFHLRFNFSRFKPALNSNRFLADLRRGSNSFNFFIELLWSYLVPANFFLFYSVHNLGVYSRTSGGGILSTSYRDTSPFTLSSCHILYLSIPRYIQVIYLSIYLLIYLSIYLFIYPSIYLFIYLSI